MSKRYGLKTWDVILMAALLITALLLFFLPFFAKKGTDAEIYIAESDETRLVPLEQDGEYTFLSRGVRLTVSVKDGKISVSDSDCRDGICKNTPPISKGGQSIVCAPGGVIVRVVGEESDVDAVSG